jgi:hypothetical protein
MLQGVNLGGCTVREPPPSSFAVEWSDYGVTQEVFAWGGTGSMLVAGGGGLVKCWRLWTANLWGD